MITKERLQELIEQCATVYMARTYTDGIYLMPDDFEVNDKELVFKYKIYAVPLEDLFETEEEAKWHEEFDCIERTERLDLPTWEEFETTKISVKFFNKNKEYLMHVFIKNKNTNNCRIIIYADDGEQDWIVFEQPLTKENYTLACRKCKELFLGENK